MVDDGVGCVPGHIEDFYLRPQSTHLAGEIAAAQPGHHDVREHQMDLAGEVPAKRAGLLRLFGRQHRIPATHQDGARQLSNLLVIFDQENRFVATHVGDALFFGRYGLGRCIHDRKVDFERGPLSRFTVNPDIAPTLLHDSVRHGETEPSSSPQTLRGEEWLEDSRQILWLNSHAGIAYGEEDVPARLARWMVSHIV